MGEVLFYSARFVQPFTRLLRCYPEYNTLTLSRLEGVALDERIPLEVGLLSLKEAVDRFCDPDIGLKAGRLMSIGSGGLLDYVTQSAATVREGNEIASRYARLYSDSIEPKLQIESKRAFLRLDSWLPFGRTAADFTVCAWYTNHIRAQLRDDRSVECWFTHPRPSNTSEYERAFEPAKLRFQAPCYGFSFNADYLEAPLVTADSRLHFMLRTQLEVAFRDLPGLLGARSNTVRVRELLTKEIAHGVLSAREVSRSLRMSRRTLARRLGAEGTTFSDELDQLRRQLAVRYLASRSVSFAQIACLLGFSCQSAFHRAFKRWTGQTPCQYRNGTLT